MQKQNMTYKPHNNYPANKTMFKEWFVSH